MDVKIQLFIHIQLQILDENLSQNETSRGCCCPGLDLKLLHWPKATIGGIVESTHGYVRNVTQKSRFKGRKTT
jgi:hypothetical protein